LHSDEAFNGNSLVSEAAAKFDQSSWIGVLIDGCLFSLLAVQGEASTEIWTLVSPGVSDVAGVEAGPHAMADHVVIKHCSKSACRDDS
jgi:hypothetical protein